MPKSFDNIEPLSIFHVVAECGSFTRAAELLHQSKSHVSKQVKFLENAMQTQLLQRTTRSLRLTDAGQALLTYTRQIDELLIEAKDVVADLNEETIGSLRFTCPVSLGEQLVPPLLEKYRQRYPKVKVEIDLTNMTRDLIRDGFDLAVRATQELNPNLVARPLGHMQDAVCASPAFLKSHFVPEKPEDLSKLPCLTNSLQERWNQWHFRKNGVEQSVLVSGTIRTNQYGLMRRCALNGLGVVKLPTNEVFEYFQSGHLVRLLDSYTSHTHELYLIFPAQRYQAKKLQYFKTLIIEWFKQNPEYFVLD